MTTNAETYSNGNSEEPKFGFVYGLIMKVCFQWLPDQDFAMYPFAPYRALLADHKTALSQDEVFA
jgi:hypothetical protein